MIWIYMHFLKKKVQSFTTVIRGSSMTRGGDVSSRTDWLLEKSICIIVYCDSPRGEQCRVANWELSRVIKTHQTHHITWYQLKWLIPWFITLGSDFTGCSSGTTRSTCVFVSHYWVRGKHANTNKKKRNFVFGSIESPWDVKATHLYICFFTPTLLHTVSQQW